MNLLIYIDELKYYSLRDLEYGLFLWLEKDVTPRINPIDYNLFKYFLIYNKRFNEENEDYILELYDIYKELLIDHKFMNNPNWIKKSSFSVIKLISSACCSVKYFTDRGFDKILAKEFTKQMGSHTYIFKYEHILSNFIKSFEKVKVNKHYSEDIKLTKINKDTGKFFTNDDIQQRKIKTNMPKSDVAITKKIIIAILY